MNELKNYRGNKNIPGLYQFIINRIPECSTFIEAFAGSAAITHKIQALSPVHTIVNDCNSGICESLKKLLRSDTVVSNLNALQLISSLVARSKDTMLYCDPPYLLSTRRSKRKIYEYEMSDNDHLQFLSSVTATKVNCMVSHYECPIYDKNLQDWNKEKFTVCYHGNVLEECIYYNYPKPSRLLIYEFVGEDCWDRQRVTRKINRLVKKLTVLPALERNAILARINKRLI